MKVVNFNHPMTNENLKQIEKITGNAVSGVIGEMAKFDNALPFGQQASELVDEVELTASEWQTEPLVVNLPGYGPAVAVVLAELHGRMGHFPATVRLSPVEGAVPRRFEVAEILDLNKIRDGARAKR